MQIQRPLITRFKEGRRPLVWCRPAPFSGRALNAPQTNHSSRQLLALDGITGRVNFKALLCLIDTRAEREELIAVEYAIFEVKTQSQVFAAEVCVVDSEGAVLFHQFCRPSELSTVRKGKAVAARGLNVLLQRCPCRAVS